MLSFVQAKGETSRREELQRGAAERRRRFSRGLEWCTVAAGASGVCSVLVCGEPETVFSPFNLLRESLPY